MHFCYESEKTVSGPICSRIVALYHQNSHLNILEHTGPVFWPIVGQHSGGYRAKIIE